MSIYFPLNMEAKLEEIKSLISKDKVKQALKEFLALTKTDLPDLTEELLLYSSNWQSLQKRKRLGLLTFREEQIENNQIIHGLLELLSAAKNQKSAVPQPVGSRIEKTKILFVAANPKDSGRLRLDQEFRDIEEGLLRAKHRDNFSMTAKWAVRSKDLRRALLDSTPNILHFSGHGVKMGKEKTSSGINRDLFWEKNDEFLDEDFAKYTGGIALEDYQGNTQLVKAEALAGLFELFEGKIQCVILNACHSKVQAEAINRHIPYVIGMNAAVPDETAIAFAVAFYDALASGRNIEFSFKSAKNALLLDGLPGANIPEIMIAKSKT